MLAPIAGNNVGGYEVRLARRAGLQSPSAGQGWEAQLTLTLSTLQAELSRRLSALEARPEPVMPDSVTSGHLNSVMRQLEEHFGHEIEASSKAAADVAAGRLRELEARLRAQIDAAGREAAEARREHERLMARQLEEVAGRVDGVSAETLALRRQLEALGNRLTLPDALERRLREVVEEGAAEARRRMEELSARFESTAGNMQRSLDDVQAASQASMEKLSAGMAALRVGAAHPTSCCGAGNGVSSGAHPPLTPFLPTPKDLSLLWSALVA